MTHRRTAPALALLPLLLLAPALARAATVTVTATWNGGTGTWAEPGNWSGAVVPRNTGTDTFHAQIDGGNASASEVTLDTEETIGTLEIDVDDLLRVTPTGRLTLQGSSISGGGSIRLEGGTLALESVVSSGDVISGWGTIDGGFDGRLENHGVIEADVPGQTLALDVGGENDGTIRAIDGATLFFSRIQPNFVNVGTVEALNGSRVSSTDGFNSQGGTFRAMQQSRISLGGNFSGGARFITDADSSIFLGGGDGLISDVIFDGNVDLGGKQVRGSLTNLGTLRGGLSTFDDTAIDNQGTVVLGYKDGGLSSLSFSGGGLVTLEGSSPGSSDYFGPIRNLDNHMRGRGTFARFEENGGVVEAADGSLVIRNFTDSVAHTGVFAASPGGTLEMEANVTGGGGWDANGGTIHVTGNVATTGDVNVRNGGALVVDSAMSLGDLVVDDTGSLDVDGILRVAGDVDIDGGNETRFAFGAGSSLEIAGAGGAAIGDWANWQFMEATGIDLFLQPAGGGGTGLYLPKLVIGPDGRLVFRDLRDNGNKPFPEFSGEHVWVRTLEFADSLGLVNKNGINLHYAELIGSADQIIDVPVPEPELAWLLAAALACALAARRRAGG